MLIAINKDKIKGHGNKREEKIADKLKKKMKAKDLEEEELKRSESEMILNFDTNEEFKQMAH